MRRFPLFFIALRGKKEKDFVSELSAMSDAFEKNSDVKSSQKSHSTHITSLHCTDMFLCAFYFFNMT